MDAAQQTALEDEERDLVVRVRRLREQAREYEEGMRYTREQDAKRKQDLDLQDQNLRARERKLYQDQADFEKRKRRWEQLKEISR